VKGYDLSNKKKVEGKITIEVRGAPFELDAKRIGGFLVEGKDNPFVFAADVVANSLHHHLSKLACAKLNAPSSIQGWRLGHRVYGARDDALEDVL
jgi:hypothetical protein